MTTQNLSYIPKLATGLLQRAQGNLHLLLDAEKPAWVVVNQTGMEIVRLCDGVRNIQTIAALLAQKYQIPEERARQDVLGYIHSLSRSGLLRSEDGFTGVNHDVDEPAGQHQMPVLKGIYLHVTDRCNLRCKHCYSKGMGVGEPFSFKEICRLIDQLVFFGGDSISLSGGEPLLRRDIKLILTYASRKLKTTLLTNGILIDEEMAEVLYSLGVYVQISLDGMSRPVHEGIRGEGTFLQTMRAIELLLARNMEKRLALSITIMKSNLAEVTKLIEFALQSGISIVNMRPVMAAGNAKLNWEEINPTPDEYAKLFDELYPLFFEYRGKLKIRGCLSDFIFGTLTNPQKRGCPAGETLMVDSNGNVYPCSMVSHPDYCLGNIINESLTVLQNSPKLKQIHQQFACRIERIAKCRVCQWRVFCKAACPGVALWQKGTIWDTDELCDVRADFYSKLIFKYAELI
jgi:radical SAM protein with 4Fe4S-binding SPASM domain